MGKATLDEVVAQLHLFGMARDRVRTAMASLLGIGLTDVDALEYLERFGPLAQRDLGSRLLLTSGAITQLVDRLERMRLVRRFPHPTDRRSTLVQLVPEAELPELPEMQDYHLQIRAAAKALSPDGRAELFNFLHHLAEEGASAADAMRSRTSPRARPSSQPPPSNRA